MWTGTEHFYGFILEQQKQQQPTTPANELTVRRHFKVQRSKVSFFMFM